MKRRILYKLFFVLLGTLSVNAQQYPSVFLNNPPEGTLSATNAVVSASYILPIPGYSEVYALGVIWSTNQNNLNFTYTTHYPNPTQFMKYSGGRNPNGATLVVGDGAPSAHGIKNSTAILTPGTTYYYRSFVFAKVCLYYEEGGCNSSRVKGVWYSETKSFTTPSNNPISNNTISSPTVKICYGGTVPQINGSLPQGGIGTYTYQWQSSTDTNAVKTWDNIQGGTSQNLTPTQSINATMQVWYRRIVISGSWKDTLKTNPVMYYYLNSNPIYTLTLQRQQSSENALYIKANIYPDIGIDSLVWKKSTTENGIYNIIPGIKSSLLPTDTIGGYFYKAYVVNGIGCNLDSSVFVKLSPPDGNKNRYLYTKIDNQYWMIENLRATHYTDNTALVNIKTTASWAGLTSPAYCWYQNDSAKNAYLYGGMYNFYIDTTKICPTGWKVASTTEWKALIDYVGGNSVAGGNLAITNQLLWNPGNTIAKNQFNFNWIPAGYRSATGVYSNLNSSGRYWTRTVSTTDPTQCFNYGLNNNDNPVQGANVSRKMGLSIRCIKK